MFIKTESLINIIFDKLDRFYYSFSYYKLNDWEDIRNSVCDEIYRYMPEEFKSERHCLNWISVFVKRRLLNAFRDIKPKKKIEFLSIFDSDIEKESVIKFINTDNYNNNIEDISNILLSFDSTQLSILNLKYLKKLTLQEISKKLNISINNLIYRLRTMRTLLKGIRPEYDNVHSR